jgi:hypothetical protein
MGKPGRDPVRRKRIKWTDDETSRMVELWNAFIPIEEIERQIGIPANSIRFKVKVLRDQLKRGATSIVLRQFNARRKVWDENMKSRFISMWDEGEKISSIAMKLALSPYEIKRESAAMGLPDRGKRLA